MWGRGSNHKHALKIISVVGDFEADSLKYHIDTAYLESFEPCDCGIVDGIGRANRQYPRLREAAASDLIARPSLRMVSRRLG